MLRRCGRLAAIVAAWSLVGAVIALAVAIVTPLFVPQGWMVISSAGTAAGWPARVPASWGAKPAYTWSSSAIVCEHIGAVDRVGETYAGKVGIARVVDVYRAGWPCRMLQAVFITQPKAEGPPPDAGTIEVAARWRPKRAGWVIWVPTMPLWAGIFGNALLYGGMTWCVLRGVWYVRRRLRIRRGECPWCAYSLVGTTGTSRGCPECGNKLASSATDMHA